MVSCAQLTKDCTLMIGTPGDPDVGACLPRERGCLKLPRSQLGVSLLQALIRGLQSMGDLLDGHKDMIGPIGLEKYLCRLVVLLITPCLWEHSPEGAASLADPGHDSDWDSLLAYIDTHLDQPLSLTQLQSQFHYSRRALQYAFRRQLGCTATQWIRTRRLDQAHDLLCHPATGDSVASIAQACGYRSMSLFSIEFQQRFHIKPSVLLRHSRQKEDRSDSTASPAD
jgi:AraC-like DNA-binding protein